MTTDQRTPTDVHMTEQIFLQAGDAAVFNLSLLTSDFFAVVAAKYLFDEELSWLYFVGFSLIIAGILVYNRALSLATGDDRVHDGASKRLLPSPVQSAA